MSSVAQSDVPEWTIRAFRSGDETAINEGFNEIFGAARPLDDWCWKFPEGELGRWIVVGLDPQGRLLTHFAALPMRVQIDGRTWLGGHVVDVYGIPRPGVRRQAVFVDTVRRFYEWNGGAARLGFVYGFPGDHHLEVGQRLLGYTDPVALPCLRRAVRPGGRWSRALDRLSGLARDGGLAVREGFDAGAVDELWARARSRYAVAAVRDARWLRTRYSARPGVDYRHLTVWRRGRAEATGVVRALAEGMAWIELVWDGEDPRALAVLDRAVGRLAREQGAPRIEMWLGGDAPARAALEAAGWTEVPHPLALKLSSVPLTAEIDGRDLVRRLYVTTGDTDLV